MIDPQKYRDIAFKSPRGVLLLKQIQLRWKEWLRLLEGSYYVSRWKNTKQIGLTPWGELHNGDYVEDAATLIFETMVWGYGIEGWTHRDVKKMTKALEMLNREGSRFVEGAPPEFILFDKWLDSLF